MLIELNYVFFSCLLVVYSVWRYFKRREISRLYLTLCFTFLALSTVFQLIESQILAHRTVLRLLELGGLALFTCFTICTIITIRKISETSEVDKSQD
jgi:hypothetical protein